jgi:5-methylcytosine-specific restriction endonuclease McrA
MRTPRRGSRWAADRVARRARYAAYMNSKAWQDKRRSWYARWVTLTGSPPVCLVCGRRWSIRSGHLHHLTYQRLGAEEPEDLMQLCARDHGCLHAVLDRSPSWRRLGRASATVGIIGMLRRSEHAFRDGPETTS